VPVLATVADDFTGASDQASMLAGAGARSLLVLDPAFSVPSADWDAVTYASRLRSIPASEARTLAAELVAKARLTGQNMVQLKYCSTFDSTPEGNIGPCLDVALDAFEGLPGTIVVPALPVNGRTTYQGYHFVLGAPLDESPMRDHPLNPMADANLVRWLSRQTPRGVGLVPCETVEHGPEAVAAALREMWGAGTPYVVIDCLSQTHVRTIARAVWDLPLISGSSALPMELPAVWREKGILGPARDAGSDQGHVVCHAPVLALAGSCAQQTLRQIEAAEGFTLAPMDIDNLISGEGEQEARRVMGLVRPGLRDAGRVLVASSQAPAARAETEARASDAGLSARELGLLIEGLLSKLAAWAVEELGLRHLLVAGGETSGAVCEALGLQALEMVREIDPGVPLCRSATEPRLLIALKGGNFGASGFFPKAARLALSVGRKGIRGAPSHKP